MVKIKDFVPVDTRIVYQVCNPRTEGCLLDGDFFNTEVYYISKVHS